MAKELFTKEELKLRNNRFLNNLCPICGSDNTDFYFSYEYNFPFDELVKRCSICHTLYN